jgi:hypothetical protein
LPGTYSEAITRVGGSLSNSIVLIDAVVQSPAALPTFYGTFLALSVFGIGRSKVLGGTGRAFSLDLTELTLNNLYVKSPDTAVYARGTFDIQNCTVVSTNAAIAPVAVNLYDLGLEIEQSRLVSSTIFNASATLEAVEFLGALPADKIYIDGNASNLPWMPNAAAIYGNNVTDINIIA